MLSADERAALAQAGRHKRYDAGETVFAAGASVRDCATLTSGALKIVDLDRDGAERILSLVHPAGFVGEMFGPFVHHDVVALTDSELCVFEGAAMEAAIERYPALAKALLRRAHEDLHASRTLQVLSARSSAEARVSALVLAFAQGASQSPCHPAERFELPLTRGEMAQMAGLTIETVSRQLTALERLGAIRREGKRGIVLCDPALLSVLAD